MTLAGQPHHLPWLQSREYRGRVTELNRKSFPSTLIRKQTESLGRLTEYLKTVDNLFWGGLGNTLFLAGHVGPSKFKEALSSPDWETRGGGFTTYKHLGDRQKKGGSHSCGSPKSLKTSNCIPFPEKADCAPGSHNKKAKQRRKGQGPNEKGPGDGEGPVSEAVCGDQRNREASPGVPEGGELNGEQYKWETPGGRRSPSREKGGVRTRVR